MQSAVAYGPSLKLMSILGPMEARNLTSSGLFRASGGSMRTRQCSSAISSTHSGGCIGKFRATRLNSYGSQLVCKINMGAPCRRLAKVNRRSRSTMDSITEGVKQEVRRLGRDLVFDWQPRYGVTRRMAPIAREVNEAWHQRIGTSSYISAEKVQRLFNDLQLFPSHFEVCEMLNYAMNFPGKLGVNNLLCLFNEYKKREDLGLRTNHSRPFEKDGGECPRRGRRMSISYGGNDVFLGGSCNPTTWRTDIAIPALKRMNISYYNPQVTEWTPELLEREHCEKEKALVMFFVLDNQTRGVSALIEVAHLAAKKNRHVILVIQSFTQVKQAIAGEPISHLEYEELRNGQEVVKEMVERTDRPVFDDIIKALQYTEDVVRTEKLSSSYDSNLDKNASAKLRDEFDRFADVDSGLIKWSDFSKVYHAVTGRKLSTSDLNRLATKTADGATNEGLKDGTKNLSFDQFCELMRILGSYPETGNGLSEDRTSKSTTKSVTFNSIKNGLVAGNYQSDIYLGGSNCSSSWREEIALPVLKRNGLTCAMSSNCHKLSFEEIELMDRCRVLLFVITSSCRSIAAMAIAGHYVGLGRRVVLCVQRLPDNCLISGEKLSYSALKDYNRGRVYLTDLAERDDVPVYSDISEAVDRAVRMCKS